ncbi:hypothetical protein ABZT26_25925 [Streptomyces sp. NPDC005395]|uniref:hypothetical protein n=1 Tax=Streptomyces sp. NPDC005395 TaxID=3157042 RepID=UPI0033B93834
MADEPSIPQQGGGQPSRMTHPSLQHSNDRIVYMEPEWTTRDLLLVIGSVTVCLCVVLGWMSFLAATILEPVLTEGY